MAAAAGTKMAARWRDALRGGTQHFQQAGARMARLFFGQLHPYLLPWQSKWHKTGSPVFQAAEAVSAVSQADDLKSLGFIHVFIIPAGE